MNRIEGAGNKNRRPPSLNANLSVDGHAHGGNLALEKILKGTIRRETFLLELFAGEQGRYYAPFQTQELRQAVQYHTIEARFFTLPIAGALLKNDRISAAARCRVKRDTESMGSTLR